MKTNVRCIVVMLAALCTSEDVSGALVYPRLLESRSTDGSKVVQIDHQLTLTLEETSLFHERLELSAIENGENVIRNVPSTMYSRHLRQDKEHLASVMLYETSHGIMLTGILNSSHLIEPVHVLQRDISGTIPHKIQRIAGEIPYASIEQRALKDLLRPRNFVTAPPKAYTLEMALFADQWAQKNVLKRARIEIISYYLTSINALILRLSRLNDPIIYLKVVGIYRAADRVTSQIKRKKGFYLKDITRLLLEILDTGKLYEKVDFIIFATGMRVLESSPHVHLNVKTEYGFFGQLCQRYKIGYVVDQGFYQFINALTRVTARLMGANYDVDKTQMCSRGARYLMSTLEPALPYAFSMCTRVAIRKFMDKTYTTQCKALWYNETKYLNDTEQFIPGLNLSPAKFCNRIFPKYYRAASCSTREYLIEDCTVQCCIKNGDVREVTLYRDALDGMKCRVYGPWLKKGRRGICKNGRCFTPLAAPPGEVLPSPKQK